MLPVETSAGTEATSYSGCHGDDRVKPSLVQFTLGSQSVWISMVCNYEAICTVLIESCNRRKNVLHNVGRYSWYDSELWQARPVLIQL
jgi:heme exporter protein D